MKLNKRYATLVPFIVLIIFVVFITIKTLPVVKHSSHINNGYSTVNNEYSKGKLPNMLYNNNQSASSGNLSLVRNMMLTAWNGYYEYARGYDELLPVSKRGRNWGDESWLYTPMDALDTLFLMKLDKEYQQAKELIINWQVPTNKVNVFETTIRTLGGLLAGYELEGCSKLLEKAVQVADTLLMAFQPSGLPYNVLDIKQKKAYSSQINLAECGTLLLEFVYLSDVTGDPKYTEHVNRLTDHLFQLPRDFVGLFPSTISMDASKFYSASYGIGGGQDSFYEYLLKHYLVTGNETFYQWYYESAQAYADKMAYLSPIHHYAFIPNAFGSTFESSNFAEHLSCFAGGWFALGSQKRTGNWTAHLHLGKKITETCFASYMTPTGLGPESFRTDDSLQGTNSMYQLRPETVESIFYLWRLTKDQRYRDMGYIIMQNLEASTRIGVGYSSLQSVYQPGSYANKQESFFLAETLKYLFLLFSDDQELPLDQFVFNTEAHPLSIRGHGRRANKNYTRQPLTASNEQFGKVEPITSYDRQFYPLQTLIPFSQFI